MAGLIEIPLGEEVGEAEKRILDSLPPHLASRLQREIEMIAMSDIRARIMTGTDVEGKPFAPLKHERLRGGSLPLQDSGMFLASIDAKFEGGVLSIISLDYGAFHNKGGVIRPKPPRKFLAIPATRDAQLAGSPRRFGEDLQAKSRDWSKGGVLYRELPDGSHETVFYLTKSVTVPERRWAGVSDTAVGDILDAIARTHAEALAEGF